LGVRLVFITLLLSGCAIDASIEGKRCPCSDGYACDELRDTCVRILCEPSLVVANFSPLWATAHDIRWSWEINGPAERFLRYELRLAESKEDLASMSGSAQVLGADVNPELGFHALPFTGGAVTATTARGLTADTTYYAQLLVTDINECPSASDAVARATRPEPVGTIELFADALPANSQVYPGNVMVVSDAGGAHLAYSAADDGECVPMGVDPESTEATCGNPLRVQEFSLDVSSDPLQPQLARLSNGNFGSAYLEMHFSNVSPIPSYYTHIWLWAAACSVQYHYEDFTLPASADYVRFEVPLGAMMTAPDEPMTYGVVDTQASGAPLCGFAISPTWHKTSVARLDNVLIRY
jgi:hypothetical protein